MHPSKAFESAARSVRACRHGCGRRSQVGPLGRHERVCVTDFDSLLRVLTTEGFVDVGNVQRCWVRPHPDPRNRPKIGGRRAHIAAYESVHGRLPSGMVACHKCDVPGCANPFHMWEGTQAENLADMWAKGRGVLAGFMQR